MAASNQSIIRIFESPKLDSRVKSANTQRSEQWLGYFLGPCLVYMAYYGIAGIYLTILYGRFRDVRHFPYVYACSL